MSLAQRYFVGDIEWPGGWGSDNFKPPEESGIWLLLPGILEHGFLKEVVISINNQAVDCGDSTTPVENALSSRLVDAGLQVHRASTMSEFELGAKIPSWEGRRVHFVHLDISGGKVDQNTCVVNLSYTVAFDAVQYAEVHGVNTAWVYRHKIYHANLPLLLRADEIQQALIDRSRIFAEDIILRRHDARNDPAFQPWSTGSPE